MYNISNDLDYKVYIYDNSFFENEYLNSGKQYTADLIKNIAIDYKGVFINSKISDLTYNYEVIAEIKGYNKNNNESGILWDKKYDIEKEENIKVNNITNHVINKTLDLNYEYYNDLAKSFKKELNIDLEAYLNLEIKINMEFKVDDKIHNETQKSTLTIPLLKSTFEIEKNITEKKSETIFLESETKINYVGLMLGIIIVALTLLITIWFFKELAKIKRKTVYAKKLDKILKTYGDIIAESSNLPDYSNLDILEIANFKDLVDIEYETRNPIIYFERKADKEGWFIIIKDNHMYRYMLFDNMSTDNF